MNKFGQEAWSWWISKKYNQDLFYNQEHDGVPAEVLRDPNRFTWNKYYSNNRYDSLLFQACFLPIISFCFSFKSDHLEIRWRELHVRWQVQSLERDENLLRRSLPPPSSPSTEFFFESKNFLFLELKMQNVRGLVTKMTDQLCCFPFRYILLSTISYPYPYILKTLYVSKFFDFINPSRSNKQKKITSVLLISYLVFIILFDCPFLLTNMLFHIIIKVLKFYDIHSEKN